MKPLRIYTRIASLLLLFLLVSCTNEKTFISTWDTTKSGRDAHVISLPLVRNGNYDFKVHWGDGNKDIITEWNSEAATHQYEQEGVYTVEITGTIIGWAFGNHNALNIVEISQWGDLKLGDTKGQFFGCRNLKITAADIPDLTGVSSLENAFRECTSLENIPNLENWQTGNISRMSDMLLGATSFHQDITNLDFSSVEDLDIIPESKDSIKDLLEFWKSYDRSLTFTSRWQVYDSHAKEISLPLVRNGRYHFIVDWGDGSRDEITSWADKNKIHQYESSGIYDVQISGIIEGWSFSETSFSARNLLEIQSWGPLKWGNTQWQFFGCEKLSITAEDVPDLSATRSLAYAFSNCRKLTFFSSINNWDVSGVTTVKGMFWNSGFPYDNIDGWDTASISDYNKMGRLRISDGSDAFIIPAYPVNKYNWVLGWSHNGKLAFVRDYAYYKMIIVQDMVTDNILFNAYLYDYISPEDSNIKADELSRLMLKDEFILNLLSSYGIVLYENPPVIKNRTPLEYEQSSYVFRHVSKTEEVPLYGGSFAPPGWDPHDPDFKPMPIGSKTKVTHTDIYIERTDNRTGKVTEKLIFSGNGDFSTSSIVFSPYEPHIAILIKSYPFVDEYDLRGEDEPSSGFYVGKHLYIGL